MIMWCDRVQAVRLSMIDLKKSSRLAPFYTVQQL